MIAYRNAARSIRDAPVSVAELVREGSATELNGVGKTLDEKLRALVETGDIPQRSKLRDEVPRRPDQRHAPAGLRPAPRAPALRRARRRLAGGAARRRRGGADPQAARLRRQGRGDAAAGARRRPRGRRRRRASCSPARSGSPSRSPARCARSPAPTRSRSPARARRMTDSVKDIDLIATAEGPGGAGEGARRAAAHRVGRHAGRQRGARDHAHRHEGRPQGRRARPVRQRAPALHRVQGPQRRSCARRPCATGCTSPSTGSSTTHRRDAALRDRGGGLRDARLRVDPARAARGPRGARGRAARTAGPAGADHARGPARATCTCHTVASDGRNSVEEMAKAAIERGYEYIAITDHSASHGFGNHVTADELWRQVERVRAINAQLDGFELLIGTGVQHHPRRLAGLPGRAAGRARLGDRLRAHVVRDVRGGDDRAHGRRDRAPARSTPSAIRPAARSRRAPPTRSTSTS